MVLLEFQLGASWGGDTAVEAIFDQDKALRLWKLIGCHTGSSATPIRLAGYLAWLLAFLSYLLQLILNCVFQWKTDRLRQDCRQAQDSFKECAQFFGEESSRSTDANAFFALLFR
ncbi:uncharacterized protein LOC120356180 [Nilaparvata lugens]|uniref:uncharacterized protein LOC120356180 n=1 Tax=Nilaparvata lugens TaxID=108931 RepID=UPI00193EAA0D|nr:uncharacterized protein LOC120356180 [Nilaparvata lugens]